MPAASAAASARHRKRGLKGGCGANTMATWSMLAASSFTRLASERYSRLRRGSIASIASGSTTPEQRTRSPTTTSPRLPRRMALASRPSSVRTRKLRPKPPTARAPTDALIRAGRAAGHAAAQPGGASSASALAAQMKSFSEMPPTECVLKRTVQRLKETTRSG